MKKRETVFCILFALLCCLCLPGCAEEKGEIVVPDVESITRFEIPDNEAMAFMKKLGVGWNLGNTFDATQDTWARVREMEIERSWVGVKTSRELIAAVHAARLRQRRPDAYLRRSCRRVQHHPHSHLLA